LKKITILAFSKQFTSANSLIGKTFLFLITGWLQAQLLQIINSKP